MWSGQTTASRLSASSQPKEVNFNMLEFTIAKVLVKPLLRPSRPAYAGFVSCMFSTIMKALSEAYKACPGKDSGSDSCLV